MESAKLSAKRHRETSCNFWTIGTGFPKLATRTVVGFALLFVAAMTVSPPAIAQLPGLPSAAPAGTSARRGPDAPYTLGAGDRVRLDIFEVPEYSGEYQVLIDGTLNLPIIGSVPVQGLTLQRATDEISSRYARYIRRPLLTITLLAPRPVKIAVAGEVNRPGSYTVSLTEGRQFPTVTQALQLAGGITQAANIRQVQLRRLQSPGSSDIIAVNLWELLNNGDLSQDLTLRDGDSLFIPTSPQINPDESRTLADASFAPQNTGPIKIVVVGEVSRPGPYIVSPATVATANIPPEVNTTAASSSTPATVTQAIQVAGGITPLADIRQVQIRRSARSGPEKVLDINLWQLLQSGDVTQDVILQEGDTVVVPTASNIDPSEVPQIASASFSPNTIRVNVVGEVAKAGTIEVPPNTTLNQAVLAAGGFNNRARRSSVELIRLNANGTISKRNVQVNFAQGINDQNNPVLRNNDVVVVNRSSLANFSDTLGTVLSPLGGVFSLFNFFRIFQ
ncbi:SLBB domain-containing protein [Coleofasciculus sp. H7-2]|uniref:SLBB domain-containing protein n=1 Tax=Coleofasciculus sp. H7-2 TaxID=3351545 RepID=UPI0036702363